MYTSSRLLFLLSESNYTIKWFRLSYYQPPHALIDDDDKGGLVEDYRMPLAPPSPMLFGVDLIPSSHEGEYDEAGVQEVYGMQPLHSGGVGGVSDSLGDSRPPPITGTSSIVQQQQQRNGHRHPLPVATRGNWDDLHTSQLPHAAGTGQVFLPGSPEVEGVEAPNAEPPLDIGGAIFVPWVSILFTSVFSTCALWVTSSAMTVSCPNIGCRRFRLTWRIDST